MKTFVCVECGWCCRLQMLEGTDPEEKVSALPEGSIGCIFGPGCRPQAVWNPTETGGVENVCHGHFLPDAE